MSAAHTRPPIVSPPATLSQRKRKACFLQWGDLTAQVLALVDVTEAAAAGGMLRTLCYPPRYVAFIVFIVISCIFLLLFICVVHRRT